MSHFRQELLALLTFCSFYTTNALYGQVPAEPAKLSGVGSSALIRTIAVSKDGQQLFSGHADGVIRVWDLASRKLLRSFSSNCGNRFTMVSYGFAAEGYTVAVGHDATLGGRMAGSQSPYLDTRNALSIWDLSTGKRIHSLATNGESVASVALSSDGRRALSASVREVDRNPNGAGPPRRILTLRLWDAVAGKSVQILLDRFDARFAPVAFAPDGRHCAIGGGGRDDGMGALAGWDCKLWDLTTGKDTQTLKPTEMAAVTALAFSPDSNKLAIAGLGGIRLWDRKGATLLWSSGVPSTLPRVTTLSFNAGGMKLVGGGPETEFTFTVPNGTARGDLLLIRTDNGLLAQRFRNPEVWLRSATFIGDDQLAIGLGADAAILDASTGKILFRLKP